MNPSRLNNSQKPEAGELTLAFNSDSELILARKFPSSIASHFCFASRQATLVDFVFCLFVKANVPGGSGPKKHDEHKKKPKNCAI